MSKLIDQAIAHFSEREIRKMEIPQWGTTIYAKNLTLDDKARWLSRADGDGTDYMIYAVILGTTDEKGEAIFTLEDKVSLRKKVDPDIVSDIANFVLNIEAKTEDEREKNS